MFRLRRNIAFWVIVILVVSACAKREAKRSDRLHVSVPYEVDSLDPHLRNTISNYVIGRHFYEPLVRIGGNMTIEPVLAQSWENPDSLTWLFHLRSSVKFHSGKPVTAEDVVYTFRRLSMNQDLEMREFLQNVGKVEAVDPLTIKIYTARPVAILLNQLNFILILPAGAEQHDLEHLVDGTGPFRLASTNGRESISMVRNENYWGPKPVLRQVTFHLDRSAEQALQDMLTGRTQFVQCNTKKLDRLQQTNPEAKVLRRDNLFMKYLSFDLARDKTPYSSIQPNPFKNLKVRQAISLAIDRNQLVDRLSVLAVAATQPVPPFIFGYNPDLPAPSYDPEKAKKLLQEAGILDWRVTLHSRGLLKEAAEIVREQLERIGIHVDLQVIPDHDFFERMNRRQTSFFLSRLGCPTGDASNVLDIAMHSPDTARNYGSFNIAGYRNPEVDEAIEITDEKLAIDSRRKQLQQIMARVSQDLVWIPLYHDQDTYVLDKSLSWKPRFDSYIFAAEIQWEK